METKRVTWRKHSKEFRAEVIQACREPRASVAAIALRSGLNANVVYRWLREDAGAGSLAEMGGRLGEFLAVQLPPQAAAQSTAIRLEMRRGASTTLASIKTTKTSGLNCFF